MGYIGAFVIGAGIGFLAAAAVGQALLARPKGNFGDLVIVLLCILIAAGATLAGGLIGIFALSLWRGEALLGTLLCLGIVAALFLAFTVQQAIRNRNYRRRNAAVQEEQESARQQRQAFFDEYGRFLRAVVVGNLPVVTELLDAGMPYVAPAPDAAPRYSVDWAEATVRTPDIQNGLSLFRYSALELAARYGRTEIVALLLTRERKIHGREERRQRARAYALHYGHAETARLLAP